MSAEHPLASRPTIRLRDCAGYPVALPERSLGGRQLIEEVCARSGISFKLAAESNSFELLRGLVTHANLISFQIRIGTLPEDNKLGPRRPRHRRSRPPARKPGARPAAWAQPADPGGGVCRETRARAGDDAQSWGCCRSKGAAAKR
jgi:hypothetical protein